MNFQEFVQSMIHPDSVLSFTDKNGYVYIVVWDKKKFRGIIEMQIERGVTFMFPTLKSLFENCLELCPNTNHWVFTTQKK